MALSLILYRLLSALHASAHGIPRLPEENLTARVYDVAIETELESARNLSARLRNAVYLKREDNQPVFSSPLRGAYNKMAHIPSEALARGVITASAGNHAQGVAFSAARMGVKAVIVVPVTTPQVKVDAVQMRTAARASR